MNANDQGICLMYTQNPRKMKEVAYYFTSFTSI